MEHKYLYGYVNGEKVIIRNTPEQITAFIMKYKYIDIIITTPLDELVLNTVKGEFILKCKDQTFLQEQVLPFLVPVQMGTKRTPKLIPISEDEI